MVLALDIGNSNLVLGGYDQGKIRFVARTATERKYEADQYAVELSGILQLYGVGTDAIEGVVLSSVVPSLTGVLLRAFRHFTDKEVMRLSLCHAGSVKVGIDNPAELGMDILASAIAVQSSRPLPAAIIDMGTATKLTALDASGVLRGVAIAPGLYVSLDALLSNASLLSGIPLEAPASVIGRNTPESLKSGVVLGSAAMLDGLLDRFAAEMGSLKTVVATGGGASVVIPHCRHEIELCDTLLLDGLFKAYQNNHGA